MQFRSLALATKKSHSPRRFRWEVHASRTSRWEHSMRKLQHPIWRCAQQTTSIEPTLRAAGMHAFTKLVSISSSIKVLIRHTKLGKGQAYNLAITAANFFYVSSFCNCKTHPSSIIPVPVTVTPSESHHSQSLISTHTIAATSLSRYLA